VVVASQNYTLYITQSNNIILIILQLITVSMNNVTVQYKNLPAK